MSQVLGGLKRGLVFVVSAPAGTGKTTLVRKLQEEFPCVVESISYTTRPIRPQEVVNRDYHYISVEEFQKKIHKGDFLEHALVFGNYYGTSTDFVEKQRNEGKHVVLVIDTQGAMQLKNRIDATYIFISPPGMHVLRERLVARKSDSPSVIEERLKIAEKEMKQIPQYDYHIINDRLEVAYDVLRAILIAAEHRVKPKGGEFAIRDDDNRKIEKKV